MKFTANRSYGGRDIEVTKITSKSGNLTVKEMLAQIIDRLDKHEKILNMHTELLKEHGLRLDNLETKLNRVIAKNHLRQ